MITDLKDIAIHSGNQIFLSPGKYSLHQVISKILSLTGPADVDIITYSISDKSLQSLNTMKNKGQILTLNLILSNLVKKHKFNLCTYASHFVDSLMFCNSHIKIAYIKSDKDDLCVISSANLTENLRYELYYIITSTTIKAELNEVWTTIAGHSEKFTYGNN
jgi:hypothetical protein